MEESKHGCSKCPQITLHYSYCDYRCSIKRKRIELPNKITQLAIKQVLENNLGVYINKYNISIYQREIRGLNNA